MGILDFLHSVEQPCVGLRHLLVGPEQPPVGEGEEAVCPLWDAMDRDAPDPHFAPGLRQMVRLAPGNFDLTERV